jgi:hypothetical protein
MFHIGQVNFDLKRAAHAGNAPACGQFGNANVLADHFGVAPILRQGGGGRQGGWWALNNLPPVSPPIATFTVGYQWDNEGRMTSMQSPTVTPNSYSSWPYPTVMPTMAYQYDINGRMTGMTADSGSGPQTYATATYSAAGQMLTLAYGGPANTIC